LFLTHRIGPKCFVIGALGFFGSYFRALEGPLPPETPTSRICRSAILSGTDEDGEYEFGPGVALSSDGTLLAVKVQLNEIGLVVRVFAWTGSTWSQVGNNLKGPVKYCGFGSSLAFSSSDGTRLAVAAPSNNWENGVFSGRVVQVFDWTGSTWSQVGKDFVVGAGNVGPLLAFSSDHGTRLVVGASRKNNQNSGLVQVFDWTGSKWSQVGKDLSRNGINMFGSVVAFSSDGSRLAVGAPWDDGVAMLTGLVQVFHWTGMKWSQVGNDLEGTV